MYNHNKAHQSKNRVHISWDILYNLFDVLFDTNTFMAGRKIFPYNFLYDIYEDALEMPSFSTELVDIYISANLDICLHIGFILSACRLHAFI